MSGNKKIGFFFGAGAEACYGLPLGGRFALEIFRQDPTQDKQQLREMARKVNNQGMYATKWLPPGYLSKRVYAFGDGQFSSIVKSTLESKRWQIIEFFKRFDEKVHDLLQNWALSEAQLQEKFSEVTGEQIGNVFYVQSISVNERLGVTYKLFGSKYFSSLLKMHEVQPRNTGLREGLKALLQLFISAHGQDLVNSLNQQVFIDVPDELPIFDDIGGIFDLELSQVGRNTLELVLKTAPIEINIDSSAEEVFGEFARKILEELMVEAIDYQSLVDSYFRYLFSPKDDWAKFTRIATFLFTVRRYINGFVEDVAEEARADGPGYYHDLKNISDYGLTISGVGTANYNSLVNDVLEGSEQNVGFPTWHLNGGLNDFYDPYLNVVKYYDSVEEAIEDPHVVVPFMLTQSGTKPLTSIEMSRRYVELFDVFKDSDAVVVVGFGFNGDDGHINGLFRALVSEHQKPLVILHYTNDSSRTSLQREKENYAARLRIEDARRLHVIAVDHERMSSGVLWLDALREKLTSLEIY